MCISAKLGSKLNIITFIIQQKINLFFVWIFALFLNNFKLMKIFIIIHNMFGGKLSETDSVFFKNTSQVGFIRKKIYSLTSLTWGVNDGP